MDLVNKYIAVKNKDSLEITSIYQKDFFYFFSLKVKILKDRSLKL